MVLSSMELANIIINMANTIDLEPYDDNELVQAIRDKEANPPLHVANLLNFHSNLKYQLIRYSGELDKQRHVFMRFLAETNLQKAIPCFRLSAIEVDDYVNLLQAYQEIYEAHETSEEEVGGFKQNLITAENKLDQLLDRMFSGTAQAVRILQNESSAYPHLLEMLNKMQSGDRMQIFYSESFNYKNINEHLIGLDVQKIENIYEIFCFSNMPPANLESFVAKLEGDLSNNVIKACAAPMPTSRNADKLIAIAALKKFSRYPYSFSYFPETTDKMIPLSSLPINIIAMNQTPQTIRPVLEEAEKKGLFDIDMDLFLSTYQPKYLADEQEYKDIYRNHEQTVKYVSKVPTDAVENKYEIIRDLKNNKDVDIKEYTHDMFDEHEKLSYLLGLASSIFMHNKVQSALDFDKHIDSFTPAELTFLKHLRNECMAVVGDSLALEEDIFHAGNKLLFQVNLD